MGRILYSIALTGVLLVRVYPAPNVTKITMMHSLPARRVRPGSQSRFATSC
jgi:hypothetical protein